MRLFLFFFAAIADAAMIFRSSERRGTCDKFAFLRIQKTGSTSFEKLIPRATRGVKDGYADPALWKIWSLPLAHLNYKDIRKENLISCAVTWLRDPVKRLLSEFEQLRNKDQRESNMLDEDQWDYRREQLDILDHIRTNPDRNQALLHFINLPHSPSRNRQALYLLGFERVKCRVTERSNCCGICVKDPNKSLPDNFPGRTYDWDSDGEFYLETAKERLQQLLSFGITDCFEDSLKVMAPKLHWDANIALGYASKMHYRHVDEQDIMLYTNMSRLESKITPGTFEQVEAGIEQVAPDIAQRIRQRNWVDVELVQYAKQLFQERTGIECKST